MSFNLKNLSLFSLLRDIFYNLWVIVLAAGIAYFGSYFYVNFYHVPVYTASMTVAINEKSSTSFSSSMLTKTSETATVFQTIFQSDVLRTKVEEVTGKPMLGNVNATVINSTNLITLSATADTPLNSYETLMAVYENYRHVTDYSFENTVIYVLSYPTVPSSPSNPVSFNSIFKPAVILACGATLCIILFLSFVRDTVKNDAAVKDLLFIDNFSVVYHERKNKTLKSYLKKKNKKIILTDPLVNSSYIEAFRKISVKLEYLRNSRGKKVFMISSTNENEGKTTVAVNTAISLAKDGNKVLLLDLDLRKPSIWRFFPNIDYSDGKQQISDLIKSHSVKSVDVSFDKESGVYVIAGKKSIAHSSEYLLKDRFSKLIEGLKNEFDFILIDTSPYAMISDAEIIAKYCDGILMVVRQDNSTVDAINDTVTSLSRSATVLGCVFNDVKTTRGVITGYYGPSGNSYNKYY